MKKILFVFMVCVPSFAMNPSSYETRLTNVETSLSRVEASVSEILNILNDKQDPDDETATIAGLKTKVQKNIDDIANIKVFIEAFQQNTQNISTTLTTLSSTVADLSSQIADISATVSDVSARMDNIDATIDEKMSTSWEEFIEKKYQEYMETKKQVLDIITARKINGEDTPEYIMETAEQLQACNLEVRRKTLSDILDKLNIFASLLDSDKLESVQAYLDNTNVPQPNLQELGEILPAIVIEGEYLRVYGATRSFTRSSGFKTGLPKQGWMDPYSDYFAYGLRPTLERAISRENLTRSTNNAVIELQNALAQAKYDAGIAAAERMTFPADDFTDIVADYNRLLTRHEI